MHFYILLVLNCVSIIVNEDVHMETNNDALKLLPTVEYCGYQHMEDTFENGTAVALYQFPWMVHVRFSDIDSEFEFGDRCSGVLINNRYVLTDAYCGFDAVKVKLGQYRTNETVSCMKNSGVINCSEPIVDVRVEEKIRDGKQENGPYDFTLLRLAEAVNYTDYIRPICLPIEDSKLAEKHDFLIISGWGAPGPETIDKKKLTYTTADADVCYKEKVGLEGNVKLATVSLICAVPQEENATTACSGDHGGPFMHLLKTHQPYQWFLEGIIVDASADGTPKSCSAVKPINGIKLTPKTIQWILSSIRA